MPFANEVRLTPEEIYRASIYGCRRHMKRSGVDGATFKNDERRPNMKAKTEGQWWWNNILGALCEYAFAVFMGVGKEWPYNGDEIDFVKYPRAGKEWPDIFPDWQVKGIDDIRNNLLLRDDDLDYFPDPFWIDPKPASLEQKYVLVCWEGTRVPNVGIGPFKILGWKYGKDCKNPAWKKDPHNAGEPAFFVPKSELNHNYCEEMKLYA